jgi:hypothetical protein
MRLLFSILILGLTFNSIAQSISFQVKDSIMGDYDKFSVDNFGRIYLTREDVVVQFSKELDTLFTTSLKRIRPSSIESSKSFRTLLFDIDQSIIQFLDNTLTDIQGEVDLVNLDIQQPILVCESFGGNTLWILDADGFRLVKMNQNLDKVLITENLLAVFDGSEQPIQMKEANDMLYVLIPQKGVAIFDVFGTYMNLYPVKAKSIDAMDNHLFVQTDSTLQIIPVEGIMEPDFVYPFTGDIRSFSYTREKVYVLRDRGLFIGSFVKSK